jgi:1,4-alpha-glucan branching enzyme
VAHAAEMGFTHIELLPIAEHPFDGSWGYQPVGLFAPTARHGTPAELRALIDAAHAAGLGVVLDWVAAHFPTDPHGLMQFDGTALYEYADPREGFHPDWNTLIYDFARPEVRAFLTANARFWLEEYGADALRVDAVASMLFRDFSRAEGEWVPNVHGGRENLEAMDFLRGVNTAVCAATPGVTTIAEESDGHPGVTSPADRGGLGFGYKWNMGWMFDSLSYMATPPGDRPARHHALTFGLTYAFSERFVLAISHDEVVHGKGSMLGKMPGSRAERFANLRAFYGFMWGHPGKKLLFMGQEFGQAAEWDHDGSLDWACLDDPAHAGVKRLVADLNALYRQAPALHAKDCEADGFRWIEADDTERSVYAWLRFGRDGDAPVAVVCNFSDREHRDYRVGLPHGGRWREALNTDAGPYGGGNRGNMGAVEAQSPPTHGQPASAALRLPPLSTIMLVHER